MLWFSFFAGILLGVALGIFILGLLQMAGDTRVHQESQQSES